MSAGQIKTTKFGSRESVSGVFLDGPLFFLRDGVQGIKYLPHNKTVITISRDPSASILIRHISGKFNSYVFKLGWGVRCFDYKVVRNVKVLVTGSNDKAVRIWSPEVTARPAAILTGHKAGINDVKVGQPMIMRLSHPAFRFPLFQIHVELNLVISYDKNSTLKVWDLDQGNCYQSLPLPFPRQDKLRFFKCL